MLSGAPTAGMALDCEHLVDHSRRIRNEYRRARIALGTLMPARTPGNRLGAAIHPLRTENQFLPTFLPDARLVNAYSEFPNSKRRHNEARTFNEMLLSLSHYDCLMFLRII
jgi:hypothetical protein